MTTRTNTMTKDCFIYRCDAQGVSLVKSGLTVYEGVEGINDLNAAYNADPKHYRGPVWHMGDVSDVDDYYMAEWLGVKTYDHSQFSFEDKMAYAAHKIYYGYEFDGDIDFEDYDSAKIECDGLEFTVMGTARGRSYKGHEYAGNAGVVHWSGFACESFDVDAITVYDTTTDKETDLECDTESFELLADVVSAVAGDALSNENMW